MTTPTTLPIAILVEDDYEDLELQYPKIRLREAGYGVVVAGPGRGSYKGKYGYPQKEDTTFESLDACRFAGVIVPGGWAPDRIRRSRHALQFVRDLNTSKKLVASICHGPWVLASAEILKNRRVTCFEAIRDDVIHAGALYEDAATVVDHQLVTARVPNDLPTFMKEVLAVLAKQTG